MLIVWCCCYRLCLSFMLMLMLELILAEHGSSEISQGWATKEELARVSSTVGVDVDVGWLRCRLEPRTGCLGCGRSRGLGSRGREFACVRVGTLLKKASVSSMVQTGFKVFGALLRELTFVSISGTGSRLRPRCSSSEVLLLLLLRDPKTILKIEVGCLIIRFFVGYRL